MLIAADPDRPVPVRRDRLFLTVYFASHKIPIAICTILRGADAAIRGIVTGLWLGVLTPRLMQVLDEWYYLRGFPEYLNKDYNRSGLFDWEREAIDTYFAKCQRVLIAAGAGAGREMVALNRLGKRVDGFEYNAALARLGNEILAEEGWPATIASAPAGMLPPGAEQFDGAIVGWATYSLIAGRTARIALLKQIRERCAPGSPILLSFFYRTSGGASARFTAAIANAIRLIFRRARVEPGDTLSPGFSHRFTEEEIARELADSGFEMVSFRKEPYAHAIGMARMSGCLRNAYS